MKSWLVRYHHRGASFAAVEEMFATGPQVKSFQNMHHTSEAQSDSPFVECTEDLSPIFAS